MHDHHATVQLPGDLAPPLIGAQIVVVPNHACPVVNLQDEVLVVREGTVVDRWTVDARGRF